MMVAVSDKHLKHNLAAESDDSGVPTPAFEPNAPASVVPSSAVTLTALLYESGADGKGVDDWPLPDGLDLSRPVSELLRQGTQRAHVAAEHSGGAVALTQGLLELQEYIRWLAVLWRVYDALELGLAEHASNPVLAPTYNPTLLGRAPALADDITFLLGRLPESLTAPATAPSETSSPSTPLPPFALPPFLESVFTKTPAPLATYIDRLRELAASAETAPRLLAHAYVRYLGDLSGGQFIGARLRRSYNLAGLDGRKFYFFDLHGDGREAAERDEETMADRKRKLIEVKDWYRRGMDEGAGDDEELKAALVREANVAFVLNTHLFSLITPPPPPQPELRYYEKRELERKAKLAIEGPAKKQTWADRGKRFAFFVIAVAIGLFLSQVVAPLVAPHVGPWWNANVHPWAQRTIDPWWNHRVLPWWKYKATPVIQRHIKNQRRRGSFF